MTDTSVRADQTARSDPAHPLDPATPAEYLAGRDIMAAAGLLTDPVRFAYYGLEEAPKGDVLAGAATHRRLRAFLVNLDNGISTDVVVSVPEGKVISARQLDPRADGQMPILDSDFAAVDEIVVAGHSLGATVVIDLMARALTAGHAIGSSIEMIASRSTRRPGAGV